MNAFTPYFAGMPMSKSHQSTEMVETTSNVFQCILKSGVRHLDGIQRTLSLVPLVEGFLQRHKSLSHTKILNKMVNTVTLALHFYFKVIPILTMESKGSNLSALVSIKSCREIMCCKAHINAIHYSKNPVRFILKTFFPTRVKLSPNHSMFPASVHLMVKVATVVPSLAQRSTDNLHLPSICRERSLDATHWTETTIFRGWTVVQRAT